MKKGDGLLLHEEILLLALKDRKGTVHGAPLYHYAMGGAVLAELLLNERIAVEEVKKKKLVNLIDPGWTGDPLIDECIEKVRTAKRRASLQTWVSRFAGVKDLKHRVAAPLCRRGILRADEDTVLLIFKRKIYPEVDPGPERKLIERLRKAIFTDSREVDPRTVVLLSLANSAGLLGVVFDKKKLKERKNRIEQVINGEMTGLAAKGAIEAMHACVMVACIMPAIFTATATR